MTDVKEKSMDCPALPRNKVWIFVDFRQRVTLKFSPAFSLQSQQCKNTCFELAKLHPDKSESAIFTHVRDILVVKTVGRRP